MLLYGGHTAARALGFRCCKIQHTATFPIQQPYSIQQPRPSLCFQLRGEVRPTTRSMEGWLASSLRSIGVAAPEGFAYQGHSLRSMGASCMVAIGVPRPIYTWVGGWARGSVTVERDYIDPTVLPTPAAYALYGWILARAYTTGPSQVQTRQLLPDPLDMRPAD